MKSINKYITLFAVVAALAVSGCKKDFLETSPTDSVDAGMVFQTTDGALVALNGTIRSMYTSLTNHGNFGQKSYDLTSDMMGEDIVLHAQGYNYFASEYNYSTVSNANASQRPDRTWYYYYRLINNVNRILSQVDAAQGTQADKDYIKGVALAMRAHSYYYLVNFFCAPDPSSKGVPLYIDPTTTGKGRGTVKEVYDQVFADLTQAETLLDGKARKHISHINLATALGIHARAALQYGDYATALTKSQQAIAKSGLNLYSRAQYTAAAFNTLSAAEWMWGLEVNVEQATIYASFYSHMDNRSAVGGYAALGGQKKITKALYDKIPDGDVRKTLFTNTVSASLPIYCQTKFQLRQAGNWSSDYLLMRLSEMYLIEAEAAQRTGDQGLAAQMLTNLVANRLPGYSAASLSGSALLDEILLQRKIELWGEGFGLLDVKRLGKGLNRPTGPGNHGGAQLNGGSGVNFDPVVTVLPANSNKWLFAIPQDEINANSALSVADQNPQ